jgi:hypothetical protein
MRTTDSAERSRDRPISIGSSSASAGHRVRRDLRGSLDVKTILVDGDKGGVGKSLATRAMVQFYLEQPADCRPRLVVFDADHSNPDVYGRDGLKAGDGS